MTRPRSSYEYPPIDWHLAGDYRLRAARVTNDGAKGWRSLVSPSRVTRIEVTRYERDYRGVQELPVWRAEHTDGACPWRGWVSTAGEAIVLYADDELRFFSREGAECGRANVLRLLERDEAARRHLVRSTAGTFWDTPTGFVLPHVAGRVFWLRLRWGARLAFDVSTGKPIDPQDDASIADWETIWLSGVFNAWSAGHEDVPLARAALVAGQLDLRSKRHEVVSRLLEVERNTSRPSLLQTNQVGLVATVQTERLESMPRSSAMGFWDESIPRLSAQRALARLGVTYHPSNGYGLLERARPLTWRDALARVATGDRARDILENAGAPMYAGPVTNDERLVASYAWEYDVPDGDRYRTTRVIFRNDAVERVERGLELATLRSDELWWE